MFKVGSHKLGCFIRELLLIVASNLAMPDYTWIPSAFSDITHVCGKEPSWRTLSEVTLHWISSSLGWEFSALNNSSLMKHPFPCDIDYSGDLAVVGCLHGPDRSKGAPIYLLDNGRVVSTVMMKEELGLEKFQHIHNAVLRKIGERYYIIVQAWNPGDFAILEQVG